MSDGSSDIAHDAERGRLYDRYLYMVSKYLKQLTETTFQEAVDAAKDCDALKGFGYFSGETSVSMGIENMLNKLREGDKAVWTEILAQAMENSPVFRELKELSPFKDKLFLYVDYRGRNFVSISGEMEKFVAEIIKKKKNWKTYDSDKYAVIMPKPSIDDVEILWLRCGKSEINGPRNIEEG